MKNVLELTGKQFMEMLENEDIRLHILEDNTIKITGLPEDSDTLVENTRKQSTVDINTEISHILCKIGITPHLKGYPYITTAILLVIEDFRTIDFRTSILYPTIAQKHDTTPSRVERAIRYAITSSFKKGNLNEIKYILGDTLVNRRPKNHEFIYSIATYLSVNSHL